MVRCGRNLACSALLLGLLCLPFQNASAQTPGQDGQTPAATPSQNRMPIPQNGPATAANQARPAPSTQTATVPVKQSTHSKKSSARQKAPEAEVPQPPPPPPTLEQMAPSAPHVAYQNGQLSINAHNATLSQVLRAVQAQTGASMDIPSGASGERVVADLGPGRPRDVLATLLNGSHFNYVILGMPGGGGGVQKVILTNRQSGGVNNAVQANNVQQQPAPPEDDGQEEETSTTYPDSDIPTNSPLVPGQPQRPMDQPPPADNNDPTQQNGVKTPEQLLQELQRMQQQQQQYQQQLNPANQQQLGPGLVPGQMPPEQQQPQ